MTKDRLIRALASVNIKVKGNCVRKADLQKLVASWEPDAEDLWEYAINVPELYDQIHNKIGSLNDAREFSREIVIHYNQAQNATVKQYKGELEDLAVVLYQNREDI